MKDKQFIWCPSTRNEKLRLYEKCVYGELCFRARLNEGCSAIFISDELGIDKRTVTKRLKTLKSMGLVKRTENKWYAIEPVSWDMFNIFEKTKDNKEITNWIDKFMGFYLYLRSDNSPLKFIDNAVYCLCYSLARSKGDLKGQAALGIALILGISRTVAAESIKKLEDLKLINIKTGEVDIVNEYFRDINSKEECITFKLVESKSIVKQEVNEEQIKIKEVKNFPTPYYLAIEPESKMKTDIINNWRSVWKAVSQQTYPFPRDAIHRIKKKIEQAPQELSPADVLDAWVKSAEKFKVTKNDPNSQYRNYKTFDSYFEKLFNILVEAANNQTYAVQLANSIEQDKFICV